MYVFSPSLGENLTKEKCLSDDDFFLKTDHDSYDNPF